MGIAGLWTMNEMDLWDEDLLTDEGGLPEWERRK